VVGHLLPFAVGKFDNYSLNFLEDESLNRMRLARMEFNGCNIAKQTLIYIRTGEDWGGTPKGVSTSSHKMKVK
jgi:hypothetical protein